MKYGPLEIPKVQLEPLEPMPAMIDGLVPYRFLGYTKVAALLGMEVERHRNPKFTHRVRHFVAPAHAGGGKLVDLSSRYAVCRSSYATDTLIADEFAVSGLCTWGPLKYVDIGRQIWGFRSRADLDLLVDNGMGWRASDRRWFLWLVGYRESLNQCAPIMQALYAFGSMVYRLEANQAIGWLVKKALAGELRSVQATLRAAVAGKATIPYDWFQEWYVLGRRWLDPKYIPYIPFIVQWLGGPEWDNFDAYHTAYADIMLPLRFLGQSLFEDVNSPLAARFYDLLQHSSAMTLLEHFEEILTPEERSAFTNVKISYFLLEEGNNS